MTHSTMNSDGLHVVSANGSEKASNGSVAVSASGIGAGSASGSRSGKRQRRGIRLMPEHAVTPPEALKRDPVPLGGSVAFEAVGEGGAVSLPAPVFDRAYMPDYLKGRHAPPEWQRMVARVCNPDDEQLEAQIAEMRSLIDDIKAAGGSVWWAWAQVHIALGGKVYPGAINNKSPLNRSHGSSDATDDLDTIRGWMQQGGYYGHTITDEHNMFAVLPCIDIDQHEGGPNGLESLQALEAEVGEPLPATLSRTKADGSGHRFYRIPQGFTIRDKNGVRPGIDLKGFVKNSALVAPSRVGDYVYKFDDNGHTIPVYLPVRWAQKLQELTDKRGAVSVAGTLASAAAVLDDQTRDDVHAVIRAFMATVVAASMPREDWLVVMAAAKNSGFDPEVLRPWSELDARNPNGFDTAWNSGLDAHPTTILKQKFLQQYGIQNPATVRATNGSDKAGAARLEALGLGAVPDYIPVKVTPELPVEAVSDDRALVELEQVMVKGAEVWARVQAGESVGHDAEWLFIAGMLTMNTEMVKYQVEHNHSAGRYSSPYVTNSGKVRGIIMHTDGSKPQTAGDVDMNRFTPDWVGGTADAVTRLVNRIMLARDAIAGDTPTGEERALTHRVFELSSLGKWWVEHASAISTQRNGWSLKSAVDNGLSRAKRYNTNTHAAVSGSGIGVDGSGVDTLTQLRNLYAVPWGGNGIAPAEPVDYALPLRGEVPWVHWRKTRNGYVPTCTPENMAVLLAMYGHRLRWNDMRYRPEYEGFPCDAGKDNEAFQHAKGLCARNNLGWKDQDIADMMTAWAFTHRFHPAKEWIESKPWDGVSRIVAFADTVTVQEGQRDNWLMYFRRWALGAIHALYSPTGGASKHALVLQGAQSRGKTSWFRTLAGGQVEDEHGDRIGAVPVLKEGVMLDVKNKDSVAETVTWWLVELGELEATYSKRQLADLKAFMTRQEDEWRAPFDRKSNTHKRRTAFVGTVNGEEALADYGGNTRWAAVTAVSIDYQHNVDAQQLWAECLHIWKTGTKEERRHWLTQEEEAAMEAQNDQYVARGGFYDVLASMFDWTDSEWTDWVAGKENAKEPPFVSNARLHEVMGFTNNNPPEQSKKNEIAEALKHLGAVRVRNASVRGFRLPKCKGNPKQGVLPGYIT